MREYLKKNKWLMVVTSIIILLPILGGVLLWDKLPERVPFHWGINGEVDGWASKPMAVFGLPPFMLGLSWSSTERMSSQQADILTSELTALRRTLTPMAERVCRLWLRMHGYGCAVEIKWDEINLQDMVDGAKAELYREQARRLKLENDAQERKGT